MRFEAVLLSSRLAPGILVGLLNDSLVPIYTEIKEKVALFDWRLGFHVWSFITPHYSHTNQITHQLRSWEYGAGML